MKCELECKVVHIGYACNPRCEEKRRHTVVRLHDHSAVPIALMNCLFSCPCRWVWVLTKCNERQKNAIGVLFVNTYLTMVGNHVHCIPSAGKAAAH